MKRFFLVTLITLFALGMFFISCKKEDTSCTCEGEGWAEIVMPAVYGVKTCKDLGPVLTASDEEKITCKKN